MRRRNGLAIWRLLGAWLLCLCAVPAQGTETVSIAVIANDPVDAAAFRVVKEAYRRIGVQARPVTLPSKRAVQAADAGTLDGDTIRVMGTEKQYRHLLRVPERVLSIDTYAYTAAAMSADIKGWDSLRPYRVCIRHGILLQEAQAQQLNVSPVESVADEVKMLQVGRCQVATMSKWAWLEIDRQQAAPMRQWQPALSATPMFHYLNANKAHLVMPLTLALRQMQADGSAAELLGQDDPAIELAARRSAALRLASP